MKYEIIKEYDEKQFRRITGVKRATFNKMAEILKKNYAEKHKRRGRKSKLSIENQLLAALEYWTYAHIAASYGIAYLPQYKMNRRYIDKRWNIFTARKKITAEK